MDQQSLKIRVQQLLFNSFLLLLLYHPKVISGGACGYAYNADEKFSFSLNQCNHVKQELPSPAGGVIVFREEWFRAICNMAGAAQFDYYSGPGCDPETFVRSVPSPNYNCNAYFNCEYHLNTTKSSAIEICDSHGDTTYNYFLAKDEALCVNHYSFSYGATVFSRNLFVSDDCSGPPQKQEVIMAGCSFSSLLNGFAQTNINDKSDPIIWKALHVPQLLVEADIEVLAINVRQTTVEIELKYRGTRMSDVWFGIGFGNQMMSNTYALIYQPISSMSLENRFEERQLADHNPGVLLPSSLLFRNAVASGPSITVTAVRPKKVDNDNRYFSFDFNPIQGSFINIPIIYAHGTTKSFQYHGAINRGVGIITLECVGNVLPPTMHMTAPPTKSIPLPPTMEFTAPPTRSIPLPPTMEFTAPPTRSIPLPPTIVFTAPPTRSIPLPPTMEFTAPPTRSIPLPPTMEFTAPPTRSIPLPPTMEFTAPPTRSIPLPPTMEFTAPPTRSIPLPPTMEFTAPPTRSIPLPPTMEFTAPPTSSIPLPPTRSVAWPPSNRISLPPSAGQVLTLPPSLLLTLPPIPGSTIPPQFTRPPTLAGLICSPPDQVPCSSNRFECAPPQAEWSINFINTNFDNATGETIIMYQVCTSVINPPAGCNPFPIPSALTQLWIQAPCGCEKKGLLEEFTNEMIPSGFFGDLYDLWLWQVSVPAGQCASLALSIFGKVPLQMGKYRLSGDNRYVEGAILSPDICVLAHSSSSSSSSSSSEYWNKHHSQKSIRGERKHWKQEQNSKKDRQKSPEPIPWHNCLTKDGVYPDFMCDSVCDHIENVEWGINFINRTYDLVGDLTRFFYQVSTYLFPPSTFCSPFRQPIMLSDLLISVGCDCSMAPFHIDHLNSMTQDMHPLGHVFDSYWYWSINVDLGQSQIIQIVLKGNVPSACNGQATLGGWNRCATQKYLPVPDPCANSCLQGKHTPWYDYGSCSRPCGGGLQERRRDCVSICNGGMLVDNCLGDSRSFVHCNTMPCESHHDHPFWAGSSSE